MFFKYNMNNYFDKIFVINLNDGGTQKLVMQVDEERAGPSANPGN